MSEPWIRVHANLARKKVVARAMSALDVSKHTACGLLVELWGNVAQHAVGGAVADVPDMLLEQWADWRGEPGCFATFVRAHHVDENGVINEWQQYAGLLEERRERERERKAEWRKAARPAPASGAGVRTDENQAPMSSATSMACGTSEGRPADAGAHDNDKRHVTSDDISVVDEQPGERVRDLPDESHYAATLTAAINQASAAQWGEQPNVLRYVTALEPAGKLIGEGVPLEFACASAERQIGASKLKRRPNSVAYFVPGIESDWGSEQQRQIDASTVIPLNPNGSVRGRFRGGGRRGRAASPAEQQFANSMAGARLRSNGGAE